MKKINLLNLYLISCALFFIIPIIDLILRLNENIDISNVAQFLFLLTIIPLGVFLWDIKKLKFKEGRRKIKIKTIIIFSSIASFFGMIALNMLDKNIQTSNITNVPLRERLSFIIMFGIVIFQLSWFFIYKIIENKKNGYWY